MAGLAHVFSGPDHLAAVAPLAIQRPSHAWNAGFRWGLGHSGGVILVGLCTLLLREVLLVDLLSSWAERLGGIVLIGIGLWGIRKAFSNQVHSHEHIHDGRSQTHIHAHLHETAHTHLHAKPHIHTHAAFAIGALHGLAGSSHFLGVLPALAFPTRFEAIGYLAAYGVGTIFGMASFSSILGWAAQRLAWHGAGIYRALLFSCSAAALIVGGCWLSV